MARGSVTKDPINVYISSLAEYAAFTSSVRQAVTGKIGLGSADISTVTCKSTPVSPKAKETASVSAVLKTSRNSTAQISPFSGLKF